MQTCLAVSAFASTELTQLEMSILYLSLNRRYNEYAPTAKLAMNDPIWRLLNVDTRPGLAVKAPTSLYGRQPQHRDINGWTDTHPRRDAIATRVYTAATIYIEISPDFESSSVLLMILWTLIQAPMATRALPARVKAAMIYQIFILADNYRGRKDVLKHPDEGASSRGSDANVP